MKLCEVVWLKKMSSHLVALENNLKFDNISNLKIQMLTELGFISLIGRNREICSILLSIYLILFVLS